ncbi:Smr/MutS family protein [Yoonia sp.]|uniref:Smr/MutS family protein n=1 Tax=Yoonia sp. TaxID=2212373 RepID=UPI0019EE2E83|nr:Smr/MutS family protein [Yoonia sp.]MBE0413874.1 Smr/MutS family protein [Yoonia sp.]
MRRPRHLSSEERALWDRVADRATPLEPQRQQAVVDRPKLKKPVPRSDPMPDFRVGQSADMTRPHDLSPQLPDRLARATINMDHKAFGKMTRGKLKPEARIDLHGMTMAQAHPELVAFILGSQALGRRLVLVITGKGKDRDDGGPIPTRYGVLRHQVPQWLALPPLAQAILQITPAHLKHGGHGAYYVYLRRGR